MSVARDEGLFLSAVAKAQVEEPLPKVTWALYLLLAALVVALSWSALAQIDQVTRSEGRIVPEAREQVIASMEMGTLRELLVREGQQVEQGQDLARLDPTRVESAQNEGQIKRLSLMATVARLTAEASARPLQFPPSSRPSPASCGRRPRPSRPAAWCRTRRWRPSTAAPAWWAASCASPRTWRPRA